MKIVNQNQEEKMKQNYKNIISCETFYVDYDNKLCKKSKRIFAKIYKKLDEFGIYYVIQDFGFMIVAMCCIFVGIFAVLVSFPIAIIILSLVASLLILVKKCNDSYLNDIKATMIYWQNNLQTNERLYMIDDFCFHLGDINISDKEFDFHVMLHQINQLIHQITDQMCKDYVSYDEYYVFKNIVNKASMNLHNNKILKECLYQLFTLTNNQSYEIKKVSTDFTQKSNDKLLATISRYEISSQYHEVFDDFIVNYQKIRSLHGLNSSKFDVIIENLNEILLLQKDVLLINKDIISLISKVNSIFITELDNIHHSKIKEEETLIATSVKALNDFISLNGF